MPTYVANQSITMAALHEHLAVECIEPAVSIMVIHTLFSSIE